MNVCFRSNIRVVDFFPHNIEDFSHRLDDKQYNDAPDADADDMELEQPIMYEWMFYLIVEGCESKISGEKIRVPLLVHGQDAEFLLNLDATK
jgi:protection of telomeres protein 1